MCARPTIVFPALLLLAIAACGSSKEDGDKAAAAPSTAAPGAATEPGAAVAAPSAAVGATPKSTPANLAKALEGDWADRFLALVIGHQECANRIAPLEALAAEAGTAGQTAWQAEALAAAANCLSSEGDKAAAVERLATAVSLGYSDCYFLRTDEHMKSLTGTPGYGELLGKVMTSMPDVEEAVWLTAEYSAVFHDISMMISENMNRVDSEMTTVPMSQIPTRATQSSSVMAGRAMLAAVQRYQQNTVMESDRSRVHHNTNMGIIDSMGDGTGSGRSSDTRVTTSRLAAAESAGIRTRAVQARAYKPSSASAAMVACSSIPD